MICTFVVSLLLISSISIAFFFIFLDVVLDMSVESIFYAHTHSILGDIIQVKKNDFMLSQNELKITQAIIVDLIIGAKSMRGSFNPESLAGPKLNDLSLFYSYCGSAYYY
jgi:hypothetical protein